MLFDFKFNGVDYQAVIIFPMNLHIFKFASVAPVNSLRFLFDFEKNQIDTAFFVHFNKRITAERTLIAVNNFGIVFSARRFNSLHNCVLTNVAKKQSSKTEETNRQYH